MDWDKEIENLKKMVFQDKLSYEKIGRMYGCTGTNIKRVMKRRGIELLIRSKNANKEPANKGKKKKYFCICCGKEIKSKTYNKRKYCSNKCQQNYEYQEWIKKYKQDNSMAQSSSWGQIPPQLRRYIFEKFNNKCCKCGWNKINPYTKRLPLEVDHIDGNSENNSESNLQLLCPNCHSLTSTYRGANRGFGRNITWIPKRKSAQVETPDVEEG